MPGSGKKPDLSRGPIELAVSSIAIINAGGIATGDIDRPLSDANTLVIRNGLIEAVGWELDFDANQYEIVLDARGCLIAPGLIDSHVHVVLGDYTPRQQTVGFLESYVHGGIARCMSASEVHAPGRPTDPVGVKALAITAFKSFEKIRPGGMRVHGGSLILEPGLTDQDFAELAAIGIWQAKAGMGNFSPDADAAPYVRLAQRHGMKVMCHTGGASIPGSSPVSAADLLELMPDVSGHVNGGTTALPDGDLARVVDSGISLQICQAGNLRSALQIVRLARERNALARVLIASDTPTGTGVMPLAVLKSVVELASLVPIEPEVSLCMATGNVGRAYGIRAGVIQPGWAGDVILLDAPLASAASSALEAIAIGDIPGIGAGITAGVLRFIRSRNSPPATHMPVVLEERISVWTDSSAQPTSR
jgi:enamidase